VLLGGALVLNELRSGLINTRIDSLTTQGELIANVIDLAATVGDPEPRLAPDQASDILQSLFIPRSQRARLFDAQGNQLADSYVVADRVESRALPPARKPGQPAFGLPAQDPDTKPKVAPRRRARPWPPRSPRPSWASRWPEPASTRWASGWCRCRSPSSTCAPCWAC
jgi:two-component system sensor histidine kinase ChvG